MRLEGAQQSQFFCFNLVCIVSFCIFESRASWFKNRGKKPHKAIVKYTIKLFLSLQVYENFIFIVNALSSLLTLSLGRIVTRFPKGKTINMSLRKARYSGSNSDGCLPVI